MYIFVRQRHRVVDVAVERRLAAAERLLLLLLERLLQRLVLDRNRDVFGTWLVVRVVRHRQLRRLGRRVVLHDADLHGVGADVLRLLHQRVGVVALDVDYHVCRLPEVVVRVLDGVERLLVTAALLVLLLQRLHLEARLVALIVDAGEDQHVQDQQTAPYRDGHTERRRVGGVALEARRIARVARSRRSETAQIANGQTCGEGRWLHRGDSCATRLARIESNKN